MAQLIKQVVGHTATWSLLQNRLGQLPHALAFVGPSGIGKKMVAWSLAQALVCEHQNRPCGECGSCLRVDNRQNENVLFIEPEKGSIRLEASEQILHFLTLRRVGRARVVLIDGAQLMNPQAANALLKVIEEPPEQTYFILIVSEFSQLLPTLRSRVQVLRLMPLSEAELRAGADKPEWMVRSARGSFEQLALFVDAKSEELRALTFSFLNQALAGHREGLSALLEQTKDRDGALRALHFLQQLLRDWTMLESDHILHSDLREKLRAFPAVALPVRVDLWRKAFAMEIDFNAHVDRGLLFENFFYRVKEAV